MSVEAGGFAADPARLRAAAGRTVAAASSLDDAVAVARRTLATGIGGPVGPALGAALAEFDQELVGRAAALAEVVRAGAAALERTAHDYLDGDRGGGESLGAVPGSKVPRIGEVLG